MSGEDPAEHRPARHRSQTGRTRLTALLIDDVSEIRMLLRLALEDVGVDVVAEAADGAAGVEAARASLPDMVILDVSMPVMDGLTALPEIRQRLPDAKIIVFSSFDRALYEDTALSRGADAYVEKGQVDRLLATVVEFAGSASRTVREEVREQPLPSQRRASRTPRAVPALVVTADERAAAPTSLTQLAEPIAIVKEAAGRLARRWEGVDPDDRELLVQVIDAAQRAQALLDSIRAGAEQG